MSKRKTETGIDKDLLGYRYVGDGVFILGVPARDLNGDEAAIHGAEIQAQQTLINRILYEPVYAEAVVAADVVKE